ncbi:hypothetical protein T484DRAFT_1979260 [Baffinella frigidus]|nr:hypothetical protein T484DRAFT_1979260 [Cryptophyta sp. CCMP2293]
MGLRDATHAEPIKAGSWTPRPWTGRSSAAGGESGIWTHGSFSARFVSPAEHWRDGGEGGQRRPMTTRVSTSPRYKTAPRQKKAVLKLPQRAPRARQGFETLEVERAGNVSHVKTQDWVYELGAPSPVSWSWLTRERRSTADHSFPEDDVSALIYSSSIDDSSNSQGILRSSEIVPRLQLPAAVLQGERPAGRPPAQHQEQEQAQAQEEEMEREAEERESEREEGGGSFARSDARSVSWLPNENEAEGTQGDSGRSVTSSGISRPGSGPGGVVTAAVSSFVRKPSSKVVVDARTGSGTGVGLVTPRASTASTTEGVSQGHGSMNKRSAALNKSGKVVEVTKEFLLGKTDELVAKIVRAAIANHARFPHHHSSRVIRIPCSADGKFRCPICERAFCVESNMMHHVAEHVEEDPAKFYDLADFSQQSENIKASLNGLVDSLKATNSPVTPRRARRREVGYLSSDSEDNDGIKMRRTDSETAMQALRDYVPPKTGVPDKPWFSPMGMARPGTALTGFPTSFKVGNLFVSPRQRASCNHHLYFRDLANLHRRSVLHPKPETRNPKPETQNPNPEIQNPKPETRNPRPEIRSPRPETRNPKP